MRDASGRRLDSIAIYSAAELDARTAARPTAPPAGVKAVFLGDSITHRSNAAAGRGWVDQLPRILGTAVLSATSVEAGVPGDRSDQMLARYAASVRANGAQVLFLLAGTNDANQGVPLSTFAANIKAIVVEARKDGIPVVIGTVPPMGAANITVAKSLLIAQYNAWLQAWGPSAGVRIALVNSGLVSSGGEGMLGGYDSGDGIHPETLGHQQIAQAFATAYAGLFAPNHLVRTVTAFNLIGNPLFLSNFSTGWVEPPGGTGSAPTLTVAADATGTLAAGQWGTATIDNTVAGGSRWRHYPITSGFVPGDKLLVTARMLVTDIAGGYKAAANGASPTADFSLRVTYPNLVAIANLNGPSAVLNPGPIAQVVTVPADVTGTGIYIAARMLLPTGQSAKFQIGEVGVYNVTNLPDLIAAI